ncbi:hypothetical protein [Bdellovibrio sp. HCB337]|uniref:hypothetical protein n=1 Tax=Bdellovibrio sp. HCB337 TaxID=3394358 RepID=UPI0039A57DB1
MNFSGEEQLKELPKSMLILKANPNSLATSEMFLRNRGWAVYSTTDVKEALLLLLKQEYSYILISVDHSNSKIKMLPKLIAHKFKIAIMTFAETQSANSFNLLSESQCEYKVFAPVTGPAIERCIMKHTRDQFSAGLFVKHTEPVQVKKHQPPQFVFDDAPKGGNLIFPQPLKTAPPAPAAIFIEGKKPAKPFGSVHVTASSYAEKKARTRRDEEIEYQLRHFTEKKEMHSGEDTLIARATERSLIGCVEILDGKVHHKIQNVTNSGCIIVESDRFSGYLVAALGADQKMEESFLENMKRLLFKFLRENGEPVSENDTLDVTLKPVEFEPWAMEYADFLRKSVHRGDELAVAFFPKNPVMIPLEDSEHPDMAKIHLKDLVGDRRVEFDLYIHLSNNDKYVLYTPKGGVFYTRQLDRLKRQGVTHMHVPKEAAHDVAKYNAQNYINGLVDEYVAKHPREISA